MKRKVTTRRVIVLPSNFQELIILKEIKVNEGNYQIDLIRELLYLYSIGMEYYDSINNTTLYSYYSRKNSGMLANPNVIQVLDERGGIGEVETKLDIFEGKENPYKFVHKDKLNGKYKNVYKQNNLFNYRERESLSSNFIVVDKEVNNGGNNRNVNAPLKRNSTFSQLVKTRQKEQREGIKKEIINKFDNLDIKLNKMTNLVNRNIEGQTTSFEQRKKEKLEKMKSKKKLSRRFLVRRGSKLDDILVAAMSGGKNDNEVEGNEIFKGIFALSEKKAQTEQMLMSKEIEDFVEKNMKEMHKALEELRISFEEEIKNVDEEIFPDVVNGLRDDMTNDLEQLEEQYEEQRRIGVEKIKSRYIDKQIT